MRKLLAFLLLGACLVASAADRVEAQSSTYWAIDNTGAITVTPAGSPALNALPATTTYTLTVSVTNAGGTGTGPVTIVVVVPPPAAPVVNPANFSLTLPVAPGQVVGTVTATGCAAPATCTWSITGSSP